MALIPPPAQPAAPPPIEIKPFDIHKWLQEPVRWMSKLGGTIVRPRHERLSYLIFANQQFDFQGWGAVSVGPGGHQIGLTQDEGLSLLFFNGVMAGLNSVGIDWAAAYNPYFDAYRRRYMEVPAGMPIPATPPASAPPHGPTNPATTAATQETDDGLPEAMTQPPPAKPLLN